MSTPGWRSWLVTAVLVGLLALAGYFAVGAWTSMDGVAMSVHGWIALALGVVVSFAVGAGLMALVFYSARHGFDDRVDR